MRRNALAALLVSSALAFTRLALISFVIFVVLLAVFSLKQPKSVSRRIVWVYLFFFCLVDAAYFLAWLFKLTLPSSIVLVILAIFTWAVYFQRQRFVVSASNSQTPAWPGLLAAALICAYVSLPVIMHPSSAVVLRYAAKTGDDANHIALTEADRTTEGYLFQATNNNLRLIDSKLIGYPQGWHINAAFFESLIVKLSHSDRMTSRFASYLIYKTIWLFISTFMIFELIVTILGVFFKRTGILLAVYSAFAAAVLSLYLLVSVFGYGFQNFITDIALVLAALKLALICLVVKSKQKKRLCILGLALLGVASTSVWILPGAIVGLLTIAVVFREIGNDSRLLGWLHWLALVFAGFLMLAQIYMLQQHSTQGKLSSLSLGGTVPPINSISVILLFVVDSLLILCITVVNRIWLLFFTSVCSLEFLGLSFYQQLVFGEQRYYAVKLAFLSAVILASVLFAFLISLIISQANKTNSTYIMVTLICLAMLPFLLRLDLRKSAYPPKDSAPIKTATAESLIDNQTNNPELVINTSSKGESYLATKIWSSVRPYNSPRRQAVLDGMSQQVIK